MADVATSTLFWCSASSQQRASAWRPAVHSLQENASDVDVFNKVSLRAVDQKEAQTATVHGKSSGRVNNSNNYHYVFNLIQG